MLYWCAEMLTQRGWHVQTVTWTIGDADGDPQPFVERAVIRAFDSAPRSSRRLIIAKSLGTYALPWARREGVPGVWLTPILSNAAVRQALHEATSVDLAIGGEADEFWHPEQVGDTEAQLISVPGANHSLTIANDWKRSLALQNDVFMDMERHLDSIR